MFDNELPEGSRQAESAIPLEQIRNLPSEHLWNELMRRQLETEIKQLSAQERIANESMEERRNRLNGIEDAQRQLESEVQKLKAEMEVEKRLAEERRHRLDTLEGRLIRIVERQSGRSSEAAIGADDVEEEIDVENSSQLTNDHNEDVDRSGMAREDDASVDVENLSQFFKTESQDDTKEAPKEKTSPSKEMKTPLKRQVDDSENGESGSSKKQKSNDEDIHKPGTSGMQCQVKILSDEPSIIEHDDDDDKKDKSLAAKKSPSKKSSEEVVPVTSAEELRSIKPNETVPKIVGTIIDDPCLQPNNNRNLYHFHIKCEEGNIIYVKAWGELALHLNAKSGFKRHQKIKLTPARTSKPSRSSTGALYSTRSTIHFEIVINNFTELIKIARTGRETKVPQFKPNRQN